MSRQDVANELRSLADWLDSDAGKRMMEGHDTVEDIGIRLCIIDKLIDNQHKIDGRGPYMLFQSILGNFKWEEKIPHIINGAILTLDSEVFKLEEDEFVKTRKKK